MSKHELKTVREDPSCLKHGSCVALPGALRKKQTSGCVGSIGFHRFHVWFSSLGQDSMSASNGILHPAGSSGWAKHGDRELQTHDSKAWEISSSSLAAASFPLVDGSTNCDTWCMRRAQSFLLIKCHVFLRTPVFFWVVDQANYKQHCKDTNPKNLTWNLTTNPGEKTFFANNK